MSSLECSAYAIQEGRLPGAAWILTLPLCCSINRIAQTTQDTLLNRPHFLAAVLVVVVVTQEMENAVHGQQADLIQQSVLPHGCSGERDWRAEDHVSQIFFASIRVNFSSREGKHIGRLVDSSIPQVVFRNSSFVREHNSECARFNFLILKCGFGSRGNRWFESRPELPFLNLDL